MNSRTDILGRMRAQLGRTTENGAAGERDIDAYLTARPRGPLAAMEGDLVACFEAASLALNSSVERLGTVDVVPAAVARYLTARQLSLAAAIWPRLAHLAWAASGMAVDARAANGDDLVGITGVFCAVAETGTLLLCGAPDAPATVSLLPETHIAIVDSTRIVTDMEAAWTLLRKEMSELPSTVNFISGPSRTGDIEQTLVLGAHGPYRVHILIVEDA